MRKKISFFVFLQLFIVSLITLHANESILIFAGAASRPPTELAAKAFQDKTGVKVDVIFGGSGYVLSQMELGRTGDLYFPGSSDYMDIAIEKQLVEVDTVKPVVYLVNAINVQKGNPKNIKALQDLAKEGLRVAIANPDGVCVGLYAIEILETNLDRQTIEAIKKNIVNFPESCERTATSISLKTADAVIGWRVFEYWDQKRIETIHLPAEQIIRVGYIPIAVSRFTSNRALAEKFIDFVTSAEGQSYYEKYNYFTTVEQATRYIGEERPVGGNYEIPDEWLPK